LRLEVLTVVFQGLQVFWAVTLCPWVIGSWSFRGPFYLHLWGSRNPRNSCWISWSL